MTHSSHTQDGDGGRRKKVSRAALAAACAMAVFIFCMSCIPGSGLPAGLGWRTVAAHFCEFLAFGAFVAGALGGKIDKSRLLVLAAVAIASAYGASDELHQLFVPGRSCDPLDWVTDTCGALVGAVAAERILVLRARRG